MFKILHVLTYTCPHFTMNLLGVIKLTPYGITPTKDSYNTPSYDLYSAYDVKIPPGGNHIVKTDIALMVPKNSCGRICPNNDLCMKKSIIPAPIIIGEDDIGSVDILVFNHGKYDYRIKTGDKFARLSIEKIIPTTLHVISR